VGTMKNSVIRQVPPESAEGREGHTHSVTCKLCGEVVYGDSVRYLADWIKAHKCAPGSSPRVSGTDQGGS
jgi:formylmethanofuran dehydrogenase subunit E